MLIFTIIFGLLVALFTCGIILFDGKTYNKRGVQVCWIGWIVYITVIKKEVS